MGSGSEAHEASASRLGRWLAGQGVHLLTGGGGGVMASVSRAFAEVSKRSGLVIGVLPSREGDHTAPRGYPNPWVEIVLRTHLPYSGTRGRDPLSRNHINILSSDVIVALPGSAGTSSEVHLALEYGKPLIALLEHRDQIPELPPTVPVADFEAVCRFVRNALDRNPVEREPH